MPEDQGSAIILGELPQCFGQSEDGLVPDRSARRGGLVGGEPAFEPGGRVVEGSFERSNAPEIAFGTSERAGGVGEVTGEEPSEPGEAFALGLSSVVLAILMGIEERLLHDIGRVDPWPPSTTELSLREKPQVRAEPFGSQVDVWQRIAHGKSAVKG
jgi:hypothetical protein